MAYKIKRSVKIAETLELCGENGEVVKSLPITVDKRLMQNYGIPAENVISHKEAHARGYASNHGDPDHWLAKFGRDMDWFRSLLADKPAEEMYRVAASKTVRKSQLAQTEGPLKALGFEFTVERV